MYPVIEVASSIFLDKLFTFTSVFNRAEYQSIFLQEAYEQRLAHIF